MSSGLGVNLVGYLNHVIGLGESARAFERALRAAGVQHAVAALDLGSGAPRLPEARAPWLVDAELPFDVTVLWINPQRYGVDVDPAELPGRWLVGRWAWELPEIPDSWREATDRLSEIWTASRFVAAAVRSATSLPVRVMPVSVSVSRVAPLDRRRWGVARDRALFVFMFDHHSVAARKNPFGLIAAFARAFPDARDASLLIKTINRDHMPAAAAQLTAAAEDHPGVQVVDVVLSGLERSALIAGCSCYVSLHRSEGFGMTIAEAMAYGRPVIATDYGGSTDFLDATSGYPVSWTPARVGASNPPYPADGIWAEPDLAHAAALMRYVVEAPDDAAARGRMAAARIAATHAPLAVGQLAALELERISGS